MRLSLSIEHTLQLTVAVVVGWKERVNARRKADKRARTGPVVGQCPRDLVSTLHGLHGGSEAAE